VLGDLFEWVPAADLHTSCKKAGSLEEQQTAAPDRLLGAPRAYVVDGHNVGAARKTAPPRAESCPRQADTQDRLMLTGRPSSLRGGPRVSGKSGYIFKFHGMNKNIGGLPLFSEQASRHSRQKQNLMFPRSSR